MLNRFLELFLLVCSEDSLVAENDRILVEKWCGTRLLGPSSMISELVAFIKLSLMQERIYFSEWQRYLGVLTRSCNLFLVRFFL